MARFKPIHRGLKLLPVDFDRQIASGLLAYSRGITGSRGTLTPKKLLEALLDADALRVAAGL